MKSETLIYEKVRHVIPTKSEKTVFFGAICETRYEMFFYAFIEGTPVQCFTLAEAAELDAYELQQTFDEIVDIIKKSKIYVQDKINIATITVDNSGITLDVEYVEKDARMYSIKKAWKQAHIYQ